MLENRTRRKVLSAFALEVLLPRWLLAADAPSGGEAQRKLQHFLKTVRSATGRFEQRLLDKDGKALEAPASGEFAFSRPGQFRWEVKHPYAQLIMSDGQTLWLYDPELKQVTVKALTGAVATTPAAILFGDADIETAFKFKALSKQKDLDWLEAVPREPDMTYASIAMGLDRSGGLEAMRLIDHFGQTTLLTFSDWVFNPSFEAGRFAFAAPQGVDVFHDTGL